MALIICEGFENYGSISHVKRGPFYYIDTVVWAELKTGRYTGTSLYLYQAALTLGGNYDYVVWGMGLKGMNDDLNIITGPVKLNVRGDDGQIRVFINDSNVTSSLYGVFSKDAWAFLELKMDASAGVEVRIDGQTVATYSGSFSGTANNIFFDQPAIGFERFYLDDIYVLDENDGGGSNPMNDFIGDKRIATVFPVADVQTEWSPKEDVLYTKGGRDGTYNSVGNYVYLHNTAVTPANDCYLDTMTIKAMADTPGIHIKPVMYSEDPDFPGNPLTLEAVGYEITTLTTGEHELVFSTPPHLLRGQNYWIGFFADAGFSAESSSVDDAFIRMSATYPTTPTAYDWRNASSGDRSIRMDYTVSLDNYAQVHERIPDTTTYNYSSTVGATDLFDMEAIAEDATVFAVQVTGTFMKDDANTRQVANVIRSGVTESVGNGLSLSIDPKMASHIWHTDPNTGESWTPAGVNAAKVGYKVVS